jgi:hypothetical protein
LTGNWLGAALTAATALGIAAVLSGAMALLAKPVDFGLWNTFTLTMVIMAGSFGADLVGGIDASEASGDFHFGFFPLTVTIATLSGTVWVFRRVIANYPKPGPAIGDAVRAALLFALPLLIGALIFDTKNENLGLGWGGQLNENQLGFGSEFGPSAAGAFFLGFLIMVSVLAVTAMVSTSHGWSQRAGRVHDWLAAPLCGIGTMFALLPLAGIVGLLLLLFGEDTISDNDPTDDDTLALITLIFGALATGGAWLIGLGAGASTGYEIEATDETLDADWQHLWGTVTDDEPGLWAAPVVMIAVLAVSAYVVARRSRSKNKVLGNLAVWVALLLVAVPVMVRVSGIHAGLHVTTSEGTTENYSASVFAGMHGVQSTLLLMLAAVIVATIIAITTGALDAARVRSRATSFARSIQNNPGDTEQHSAPTGSTPPQQPDHRDGQG